METSTSYLRLKGLSLQQRLPLLICILLLSLMVLFSWISYQGVKNAAIKAGKERLLSLTRQFSMMFSQPMTTLSNNTRVQANQPVIRKFLADTSLRRDSALNVLERIRQDSASVLVDLFDANNQLVLRTAKDSIHTRVNFDSIAHELTTNRDTSIGRIFSVRDSMYYPVRQPVKEGPATIGYLVRWRLLYTTPQTIDQLSHLMGIKASLHLGNADGSLWTDLFKPVNYSPVDSLQLDRPIEHRTEDDGKLFTAFSKINNTPWLVSVEFSQHNVLQSANRFLRWMIIVGLILLAVGIVLAWTMSRNIIRPLNRLTAAASGIATGKYTLTEGADRRDEVGKLARAFNTMIVEVREARHGLEQKIVESGEMNEQLRKLTAHLQNIREEERIHIAREMHDQLGQLLTAFKMDISWLQKKLGGSSEESIRQKLGEMIKLIDDSVIFVRKIASELRPSMLDDFGLVPALEWHSEEFQKRFNIKVDFKANTKEIKTSPLIGTGLFRMYQETLTNVARHAEAGKVTARLKTSKDAIVLSIHDDGKGFDPGSIDHKKTLGLLGMKERAAMIGGHLDIRSVPGGGTTVKIAVNRHA